MSEKAFTGYSDPVSWRSRHKNRLERLAERTRALSTWVEVLRNVWALAALLGLLGFVLARVAFAYYGLWPVLIGLAVVLAAAATGFAGGRYTATKQRASGEYSWHAADYTYQIDQADVLHHIQTSTIRIRANHDNVQLFRNRYWWTGVGRSELAVLSPGHKLITELVRDAWCYYYILLEQALGKGGYTTIVVRHDLYDSERKFQPMFTKDVTVAVPNLAIRVVFPPVLRPSRVLAAELERSNTGEVYWQVIHEREVHLDPTTGEVVYTVERPRLGRRYQLAWTWTGYPEPTNRPAHG